MKEEIVRELIKGKKWYQKIIIKIFTGVIVSVYRQGMIDNFNYFNK